MLALLTLVILRLVVHIPLWIVMIMMLVLLILVILTLVVSTLALTAMIQTLVLKIIVMPLKDVLIALLHVTTTISVLTVIAIRLMDVHFLQ
jgi:hypothetical protein